MPGEQHWGASLDGLSTLKERLSLAYMGIMNNAPNMAFSELQSAFLAALCDCGTDTEGRVLLVLVHGNSGYV